MEKGRIVDHGTYKDLMERNALFRDMSSSQAD
jgi:ABC-type multidrug transport system fused ATPase/permease subunit